MSRLPDRKVNEHVDLISPYEVLEGETL